MLDHKKLSVLNTLRETLLTYVAALLPDYTSKQSRKGQDKAKVIKDIIALSRSIVKAEPDADLEAVYKDSEPQLDLTNHETSTMYIKQIKRKLDETKSELEATKSEFSEFKLEQSKMMEEISSLREIIRTLTIEQKLPSRPNRSDSCPSDSSEEPDTSDTDSESDNSVLHLPNRTKKLRGQRKQLEGVPKKGFAYVGNVSEDCTPNDVHRHIRKNSKVKVEKSSIKEITKKGKTKAFKVTMDKCDVQELLTNTKWPKHVEVRPFTLPKTNGSKPHQTKSYQKNRNKGKPRNQKFQKNNSNNYRQDQNRSSERAYQPNPSSGYWNDHLPNGFNQGQWNDRRPEGYNQGYYRIDTRN